MVAVMASVIPMRALVLLAPLLGAAPAARADALPAPVEEAARAALTLPGARLAAAAIEPPGAAACAVEAATVGRAIDGSGRYPLKLAGRGCGGWAWLRVQVYAPVPIVRRALRAGEPIGDAVAFVEREVTRGLRPAAVEPEAIAARPLRVGEVVSATAIRDAGRATAGSPLKIVVQVGALAVEQTGRSVSCGGGRACAVLPSGKHVEGRLEGGRLLVEAP